MCSWNTQDVLKHIIQVKLPSGIFSANALLWYMERRPKDMSLVHLWNGDWSHAQIYLFTAKGFNGKKGFKALMWFLSYPLPLYPLTTCDSQKCNFRRSNHIFSKHIHWHLKSYLRGERQQMPSTPFNSVKSLLRMSMLIITKNTEYLKHSRHLTCFKSI